MPVTETFTDQNGVIWRRDQLKYVHGGVHDGGVGFTANPRFAFATLADQKTMSVLPWPMTELMTSSELEGPTENVLYYLDTTGSWKREDFDSEEAMQARVEVLEQTLAAEEADYMNRAILGGVPLTQVEIGANGLFTYVQNFF